MGIEDKRLLAIDKLVGGIETQVVKDVYSPTAVASNVANLLNGPISQIIEYIDELTRRVADLEGRIPEQDD